MMFKYMCLVLFITWYQLADCHPATSSVKAIDSMIEKESEAFLSVEAENSSHKNVRDKRTIGFLRQLFPGLSQIVDRKIQQFTRFVFRVIGRLVLRGGGGGAGAGTGGGAATAGTGGDAGSNGGRRISITLPTFPPSTDDEDEEAQTNLPAADTSTPVSDAEALSSARIVEPAASEAAATDSTPAASADSVAAADSAAEVVVSTVTPVTTAPSVTAATTVAAAAAADPVTNDAAPAAGSITTTTITAAAAAATATANAITTSSPTTQMPLDSDNAVGTGIVKRTARDVSKDEPSSTKKRSPLTDTGKI